MREQKPDVLDHDDSALILSQRDTHDSNQREHGIALACTQRRKGTFTSTQLPATARLQRPSPPSASEGQRARTRARQLNAEQAFP